jgi:hypothetical protein
MMVGGRWVGLFVLHNGKKRNTREKKDTRGRKRIHEGNQSIINQLINQYHSEGGPGEKKKTKKKNEKIIEDKKIETYRQKQCTEKKHEYKIGSPATK